jgi:hypothetical protein
MLMFDPMYFVIVGPAILLALWAQIKVKSTYSKWSDVLSSSRISGRDAAERVLRTAGVYDVNVEETHGFLSDHYDPSSKTLRLSPEVYRGSTVAAMGIAAHEAGHALQHAESYAPLKFRTAIVPFASIGSWISFPMILFGMMLQMHQLAVAGVIAFAAIVVFQLITLPVELDASRRARAMLATNGIIIHPEEAAGVKSVLDAAAWTYVAATLSALAQLFYFAMQVGLFGRSSDE